MSTRSAAIWVAGASLILAGWFLTFRMPSRGELMLDIGSIGASEVRVPVGWWSAAALWFAVVSTAARVGVARAIVIAAVAHVLLMLAAFTVLLQPGDPAFSAAVYRIYATLFCAAAVTVTVAWSTHLLAGWRRTSAAVAAPIIGAAIVLVWQLLQITPVVAVMSVAAGAILPALLRRTRTLMSSDRVRALITRDGAFMAAVFMVALVLRLFYLTRIMGDPGYLETGADGPVYDELAWSIAQGQGVRESFTTQYPLLLLGYIYFVAAVYWVAGHSYFAVCFVQSVAGAAACVLLYSVARAMTNVAVARVAALFAAVSFPLIFAAVGLGHQAVDLLLTMTIVWLLVARASHAWPWWGWCGVGVLFGVAIAVRETEVFFLAFVAVWIPIFLMRPEWRRGVVPAAIVLAAAFATVAPAVIPKVASPSQRAELRRHFDFLYRGEADPQLRRDAIVGPLGDPGAALTQLRESPGFVLRTMARGWMGNLAQQFFTQPYGAFDLVFLRKGTGYYYALWFYAYVLGAAGIVMALMRLRTSPKAAALALVLGVIVARTVPHLLMESNYRHRVPIEPFLILLASMAVVDLVTAAGRNGVGMRTVVSEGRPNE